MTQRNIALAKAQNRRGAMSASPDPTSRWLVRPAERL